MLPGSLQASCSGASGRNSPCVLVCTEGCLIHSTHDGMPSCFAFHGVVRALRFRIVLCMPTCQLPMPARFMPPATAPILIGKTRQHMPYSCMPCFLLAGVPLHAVLDGGQRLCGARAEHNHRADPRGHCGHVSGRGRRWQRWLFAGWLPGLAMTDFCRHGCVEGRHGVAGAWFPFFVRHVVSRQLRPVPC